jgi:hypothetical protein
MLNQMGQDTLHGRSRHDVIVIEDEHEVLSRPSQEVIDE